MAVEAAERRARGDDTRRVSVVIPTYNRAGWLRGAIETGLAQTHPDIELVVVDDGSSDATWNLLRSLDDARVVALRHERNQGLPEALNTGFRRATGAYLTWMSDDDRFAPTALAEMLALLDRHPDVDFVYADFWLVDAAGEVIERVGVLPPEELWRGNCVGACRLFRRVVYETIGDFDPATRLAEDYDYWMRVARRFRMRPLHRTLATHCDHAESLTRRFRYEALRIGERAKLAHGWTTPPRHRAALVCIDLREALDRGDRLAAAARGLSAIARDPRHLRNRLLLSLLLEAAVGARARDRLSRLKRSISGQPAPPPDPTEWRPQPEPRPPDRD